MPDSPPPAVDDELRIILRFVLEGLPRSVSIDAALAAIAAPVPPGLTYDVGPNCPRDDLYYRLEACRALERLHPRKLAPMRHYR